MPTPLDFQVIEDFANLKFACRNCGHVGHVDVSPHFFFSRCRLAFRCHKCRDVWEGPRIYRDENGKVHYHYDSANTRPVESPKPDPARATYAASEEQFDGEVVHDEAPTTPCNGNPDVFVAEPDAAAEQPDSPGG